MTGISSAVFEIRLDNEVIVLHGVESEAAAQVLRGTLVLNTSTPLSVDSICLQMTGKWRIGWNDRIATTWVPIHLLDKSTEIFCFKWPSFISSSSGCTSKGTLLMAGKYEWPFEIEIKGSMAETVEGLTNSYILYTLKGTISRGSLCSAIHDFKPVRIIRALDLAALGLAGPVTVAGTWTDKIEYRFCIPQRAIAIGTSIIMHMSVTSLLRGLKIGIIRCVLYESQEFTLPAAITAKGLKRLKPVDRWNLDMTDRSHHQDNIGRDGLDEYALDVVLPLPNRLSKCVQDTDARGIKIRHKLQVNLDLYNPEGHISELRVTLPIIIFIPPNVALDANGSVGQNLRGSQSAGMALHGPPLYGEYFLDQPYVGTGPFVAELPCDTNLPCYYRHMEAELPANSTRLEESQYGGIPFHGHDVDSISDEVEDSFGSSSGQPTPGEIGYFHLVDLPSYCTATLPSPTAPELPPGYEAVNPEVLGNQIDELRELSEACIASWAGFEPERLEIGASTEEQGV